MHKPDVAIVDIRMPPTHTDEGLRAAREIREQFPSTGVLVLSQYVEAGYALDLLADSAEGVGYLLKDRVSDLEQFAAAVSRVADGGSALDPEVVSRLVGRRREHDPLDELSPREREVLELMAEGRSNQAIAERLFVTLRAVEKHVTSIFTKLGLPASSDDHRRVLAVLDVPERLTGRQTRRSRAGVVSRAVGRCRSGTVETCLCRPHSPRRSRSRRSRVSGSSRSRTAGALLVVPQALLEVVEERQGAALAHVLAGRAAHGSVGGDDEHGFTVTAARRPAARARRRRVARSAR